MKNFLFLAAAVVAMCSCSTNPAAYVIKGDIAGLNNKVYLFQGDSLIGSADVRNGKFKLKGIAEKPAWGTLNDALDRNQSSINIELILEPGKIAIKSDPSNTKISHISGTPINEAFTTLAVGMDVLENEYKDPATTDERKNAIDDESDLLIATTVNGNLDNILGVLLLPNMAYNLSGQETLDKIATFSPEMQQTKELASLKQMATKRLKTDVGNTYIDIVQNNANGKPVSLKSVIDNKNNKYTLVDFWATWCPPCMAEVPVMKKTYDQFHKKGFEIYGVSVDSNQDKDKWISTVKEKGMNWIQVSNLSGFDSQAVTDYAVHVIPTNFLIDAQGKIVAQNLRGKALYQKIEELLGK